MKLFSLPESVLGSVGEGTLIGQNKIHSHIIEQILKISKEDNKEHLY